MTPELFSDSERLRAIHETGLLGSAPEEAFDRLTRLAARLLEAPVACVNIVDDRREFWKSCTMPAEWPRDAVVPLEESICREVILSGKPLAIEDAAASPLASSSRLVRELGVRSYLGVPLRSVEGHVIGTFYVADFAPRAWTPDQVEGLHDVAGAVMSEVSLRREVRERVEAQRAMALAREEANQANRARSEYMSRVSHELRTPMNAILGFAQLLEMDVVRENDRESVDQILSAGRHLLALIDEVLNIAEIEGGRLHLAMEPVSIDELFQECVEVAGRAGGSDPGLAIETRLPPGPERLVWADPLRLKQVLLNLLSNAVQYNRAGGTVVLSYEDTESGRLRILVRDTGPGIPAERLARLFTPLERLGAEKGGVKGKGLGLALSRALVEAMGGTLGADSVEGVGSVFWVELPQVDPEQIAPLGGGAEELRAEKPQPSHTILLIEDNLANARLIGHILDRRAGVRLLTAMQGSRGLDLAREHLPDLIILDLNLPDVPGDELLLRLRADPLVERIPVVMISGAAEDSQIAALLAAGARGFLRKPFEMQELLELVEASLEG